MWDAVVIGGGLAGLLVARHLQQHKRSFRLLESRKDVGGRLKTVYNDDGSVRYEAGAWRVHSSHRRMHALLKEFDIPLVPGRGADGRRQLVQAGRLQDTPACTTVRRRRTGTRARDTTWSCRGVLGPWYGICAKPCHRRPSRPRPLLHAGRQGRLGARRSAPPGLVGAPPPGAAAPQLPVHGRQHAPARPPVRRGAQGPGARVGHAAQDLGAPGSAATTPAMPVQPIAHVLQHGPGCGHRGAVGRNRAPPPDRQHGRPHPRRRPHRRLPPHEEGPDGLPEDPRDGPDVRVEGPVHGTERGVVPARGHGGTAEVAHPEAREIGPTLDPRGCRAH